MGILKNYLKVAALAMLALAPTTTQAQEYVPSPENLEARKVFQENRFGIFGNECRRSNNTA